MSVRVDNYPENILLRSCPPRGFFATQIFLIMTLLSKPLVWRTSIGTREVEPYFQMSIVAVKNYNSIYPCLGRIGGPCPIV